MSNHLTAPQHGFRRITRDEADAVAIDVWYIEINLDPQEATEALWVENAPSSDEECWEERDQYLNMYYLLIGEFKSIRDWARAQLSRPEVRRVEMTHDTLGYRVKL